MDAWRGGRSCLIAFLSLVHICHHREAECRNIFVFKYVNAYVKVVYQSCYQYPDTYDAKFIWEAYLQLLNQLTIIKRKHKGIKNAKVWI